MDFHVLKNGVIVASFVEEEDAKRFASDTNMVVQKGETTTLEIEEEEKEGELIGDKTSPYLLFKYSQIREVYNPDYGDDRICECGHSYGRHFDPYDGNAAVGCKYCMCYRFKEKVDV